MAEKFQLSELYRGDTIKLLVTVTRDDVALNITGATFQFTARRWRGYATATFVKENSSFEVIDAAAGQVVVTMDPADTASLDIDMVLNCEIEMTEADGRVTTIAYGTISLA